MVWLQGAPARCYSTLQWPVASKLYLPLCEKIYITLYENIHLPSCEKLNLSSCRVQRKSAGQRKACNPNLWPAGQDKTLHKLVKNFSLIESVDVISLDELCEHIDRFKKLVLKPTKMERNPLRWVEAIHMLCVYLVISRPGRTFRHNIRVTGMSTYG